MWSSETRLNLVNVQILALGLWAGVTEYPCVLPAMVLGWMRQEATYWEVKNSSICGTTRLWHPARNKIILGICLPSSCCSALFFSTWGGVCWIAWAICLQALMFFETPCLDWHETSMGKLWILSWCFSFKGQVTFFKERLTSRKGRYGTGKAETLVKAQCHSLCSLCSSGLDFGTFINYNSNDTALCSEELVTVVSVHSYIGL